MSPEWKFTVPPDQVDIDRIWSELDGVPAMYVFSYIGQLRMKAPRTYERLRSKYEPVCKSINWLPASPDSGT
jgi:hypothetical protein